MLDRARENYVDFDYVDYSIPDHNPVLTPIGTLVTAPRLLAEAIQTKIKQSSVILVPARMFTAQSAWVTIEINYAVGIGKRVIAVRSRETKRAPSELRQMAHSTVDANYRSLYNAITT